jgi:hypothetical protein
MNGADGWGDFFDTIREAARAARTTLIDRTIATHGPRARERAERLREQHPGVANDVLADRVIAEATVSAASVGAAIAAPGTIPGPGTVISVALAAPEVPWLLRHQVKLVLDLAAIYDRDPEDQEARAAEMDGLFECAFTTVHLGNTAAQLVLVTALRRGRRRATAALASALLLLAGAGGAILRRRRLLRRLPFLGIPAGALANALAVASIGNEAKQRYRPDTPPPPVIIEEERVEEEVVDEDFVADEPPTAESTGAAPEDAAFVDEAGGDEPSGDEPSD